MSGRRKVLGFHDKRGDESGRYAIPIRNFRRERTEKHLNLLPHCRPRAMRRERRISLLNVGQSGPGSVSICAGPVVPVGTEKSVNVVHMGRERYGSVRGRGDWTGQGPRGRFRVELGEGGSRRALEDQVRPIFSGGEGSVCLKIRPVQCRRVG